MTEAQLDAERMRLALAEAGRADPSLVPRAAALIVRGAQVLALAHQARGSAERAETLALARAGKRARGATLYVTVEPSDQPRAEPARSAAIVAAGITRVVIGCGDPTPELRRAAPRLRAAGVTVVTGVERAAAERTIADYRRFRLERMPWVTLKAAVTLDGRIAARSGESKWITGAPARRHAHKLRAGVDAVLVGVSTVLADDPELTVRLVDGPDPLRVVLDSRLRTPLAAKLVTGARKVPTLIIHAPDASPQRARKLAAAGCELVSVRRQRSGLQLQAALRALAERDVARVLVEGGARVHAAFLEAGLVDRAAVFVAPRILGDARAIPLADGQRKASLLDAWTIHAPRILRLGNDVLVEGSLARPRI